MVTQDTDRTSPAALRSQAQAMLAGHRDTAGGSGNASAALSVLHELASSPDTAADALALLHELQVHQVELDLQAEALRTTQAELESELSRQVQRHDGAPVSCFTVDADTRLIEINLTGSQRLGRDSQALLGATLSSFLSITSATDLRSMLARLRQGVAVGACELSLTIPGHSAHSVYASAVLDPASDRFLIAFMDKDPGPWL